MALTSVDRDPGLFRNTSPGVRLVLLCILAIALMVLDHRNEHLVGARKVLAIALHPIELLVNAPAEISDNMSESMSFRSTLRAENKQLQREALVLNARMQRMTALEAENARLRALLDSTAKVGDSILIAEIVSVDMNPYRNMLVINKGGNDGAYVGEAVIDADGIVGQITRDRHYSSEVMLVTDVDHAIPVELARNRLRTIAVGSGELDRLSLPFLPISADVRDGDLLISSGLGGTFPPGYPVAVVRAVRSVTGQPFLEIDAEPAAALNRIREVLLIAPQTDSGATDPDNDADTNNEQPTSSEPMQADADLQPEVAPLSSATPARPAPVDEELP
jgi:rod shape-determining protein MreC